MDEVKVKSVEVLQGQMSIDELFGHWLVDNESYANGVGIMYMMGTKKECQIWQLEKGVRAHTHIIKVS